MLSDPKWDLPKPQHPSLDGMIEWLHGKDPDMRYTYSDCEACLCAQYYRECTERSFSGDYHRHEPMALYLNSKVAALTDFDVWSGSCGYSVRAALKRAYLTKLRAAAPVE